MKYLNILRATFLCALICAPMLVMANTVNSFTVVNADTGKDIATFASGGTISLNNTPNINVRANVTGAKSVVFTDATTYKRTDNFAPYAYKGDFLSKYNKWSPSEGSYAIKAQPFARSGGKGTSGAVTPFTLTITRDAVKPFPLLTNTHAELLKFWERYGHRSTFPPMYVYVLENALLAEDRVLAKDYVSARTIIDTLLAKYPLSDDIWFSIRKTGESMKTLPYLGEPGVYAHVRMLDDITKALTKPVLDSIPIQITVVIPECSDITLISGSNIPNLRLSAEIELNSYEPIRQSLRLFQSYILAITGGKLRLELKIQKVPKCFQFNQKEGLKDYRSSIDQLDPSEMNKSSMFWVIYPSDYATVDPNLAQGSGMGRYNDKPVFVSEDDWVIKKSPKQGAGLRTDVERRIYLPEWIQHEFFHYLFDLWPDMKLEETTHQWHTRTTWPADFKGSANMEEDYYSEALNKRIYSAKPSLADKLIQTTSNLR